MLTWIVVGPDRPLHISLLMVVYHEGVWGLLGHVTGPAAGRAVSLCLWRSRGDPSPGVPSGGPHSVCAPGGCGRAVRPGSALPSTGPRPCYPRNVCRVYYCYCCYQHEIEHRRVVASYHRAGDGGRVADLQRGRHDAVPLEGLQGHSLPASGGLSYHYHVVGR